jgi:ferredoxin
METTVFFFTGTGNSLAFAKRLADELGDTELVSIPVAMKKGPPDLSSPKIGFVFPVFSWGPPRMVEEFIASLTLSAEQYIFAVATCAAVPGATLGKLAKMIKKRGGKLDAGFVVRERASSLQKMAGLVKVMFKISNPQRYEPGERRLAEIAGVVAKMERLEYEKNRVLPRAYGNLLHGPAIRMFQTIDKEFLADDSCVECRTCGKICPRANITFPEGRPVWNHNCEQCMACIQWCPEQAIQIDGFTVGLERYHNPEVSLREMIVN